MSWQQTLIVAGAVAAAINAGAFFAFSNFVMPALGELDLADGAAAMQAINRHAPSALFVTTIVGAGAVGVPPLVADWSSAPTSRWLLVAVVLSALSFLVTMSFNVPRNNSLAVADPALLARVWNEYLVSWTRWNTVRTITSAGSVAAFAMAMRGR